MKKPLRSMPDLHTEDEIYATRQLMSTGMIPAFGPNKQSKMIRLQPKNIDELDDPIFDQQQRTYARIKNRHSSTGSVRSILKSVSPDRCKGKDSLKRVSFGQFPYLNKSELKERFEKKGNLSPWTRSSNYIIFRIQ